MAMNNDLQQNIDMLDDINRKKKFIYVETTKGTKEYFAEVKLKADREVNLIEEQLKKGKRNFFDIILSMFSKKKNNLQLQEAEELEKTDSDVEFDPNEKGSVFERIQEAKIFGDHFSDFDKISSMYENDKGL